MENSKLAFMQTYGTRLLAAIKEKGTSRKDLASAMGVSVQAVGEIIRSLSGSFTALNHAKAVAFLGVNSHWLATGEGQMRDALAPIPPSSNVPTSFDASVEKVSLPYAGKVPLISWVAAGNFCGSDQSFEEADAEEWLICPVPHGKRAYALKVRGLSMKNPNGRPTYDEGEIIFVDPDREAKPGDRVISRLESSDQATFKQLMEEDGRSFLKALNPDWTPRIIELNEPACICGLVIGKWVPE